MTWLSGDRLTAADLNKLITEPDSDVDETNLSGLSDTSPANGTPVVGVSFVAPASEIVLVSMAADLDPGSTNVVIAGARIREGGTVGSGTIVDGGESGDGPNSGAMRILTETNRQNKGSGLCVVTALTAGDTYNAAVYYYTNTSTFQVRMRAVSVIPWPGF